MRKGSTRVILDKVHLRVESTAWNVRHNALSLWLSKTRSTAVKGFLLVLYDAGSIVGVIGMLTAMSLLGWTSVRLGLALFHGPPDMNTHVQPVQKATLHAKRELNSGGSHGDTSYDGSVSVQLLVSSGSVHSPPFATSGGHHGSRHFDQIPGITIPLSHFPLLFVSLLLSQVFHEAGHAVCAAL